MDPGPASTLACCHTGSRSPPTSRCTASIPSPRRPESHAGWAKLKQEAAKLKTSTGSETQLGGILHNSIWSTVKVFSRLPKTMFRARISVPARLPKNKGCVTSGTLPPSPIAWTLRQSLEDGSSRTRFSDVHGRLDCFCNRTFSAVDNRTRS